MLKKTTWFNIDSGKEVYGIKVLKDGKWHDAGDGSAPLFYDAEDDRDAKLLELQRTGIPGVIAE